LHAGEVIDFNTKIWSGFKLINLAALGDSTLGDDDTEVAEVLGDLSSYSQGDLDATGNETVSPTFNYSEGDDSDGSDLDIN